MSNLIYKEEAYKIIGICMEVHNQLGKGFNEVVYADALEIEWIDNNVLYSREKKYDIIYKGNLLRHKYKADFIIDDKIVLRLIAKSALKSSDYIGNSHCFIKGNPYFCGIFERKLLEDIYIKICQKNQQIKAFTLPQQNPILGSLLFL